MKRDRHFASAILLLLLVCRGVATPAPASELSDQSAAGAGARVLGKVLASGHEISHPLKVFKNRKFCGATVPNETLLVGPGGELRNAVITLTPVDRIVSAPPARVVLDNQHCAFVPHVQVAALGSDLLLRNSDPILHTVHARLGKETLFNVGLPNWRQVTKRLERAGVMRIDCDVLHTWMSAAIVVVTTPYFTVTHSNGSFSLDGLPAGAYDLEVWHERLGVKKSRVNLRENSVVGVEIVYAARAPAR